ncbi:MAG: hypothetical protein JOZ69_20705, partial [Myxococcales bacterium]|nr:hypothetical protein [Myxococcales bacterium]
MPMFRALPRLRAGVLALTALVFGGACATTPQDSSFVEAPDAAISPAPGPTAAADASGDQGRAPSQTPSQTNDAGVFDIGDGSVAPPQPTAGAQCTKQGQCVRACGDGGAAASISGTVYDPAGKNPLYGVAVFVPFQTPDPMISGPVCDCGKVYTGGAVASTLTDAQGHFQLNNVPDGKGIPLVLQIGKWRRQLTTDVQSCQDNPVADKTLRLPNNSMVGDIPNIAIATGGADTLECLLTRIGVDASEYVGGAGSTGRIHIFQGDQGPTTAPAAPLAYQALWTTVDQMMPYDIVLLSCEGHETTSDGRAAALTGPMIQALSNYASAGGRVFASHFHYAWFNSPLGPFSAANLATWTPGANTMTPDPLLAKIATTLPNGNTFPKGVAMQQWLSNVGALTNGELPIGSPRHNADVGVANSASTPWISADQNAMPPNATMYLSFDMPLAGGAGGAMQGGGAENVCGRIVYSDLHVGADSNDYGSMGMPAGLFGGGVGGRNAIAPTGCNTTATLSAQEKALEFMLFDL